MLGLKNRELRRDLIYICIYVSTCTEVKNTEVPNERTRRNGQKLKYKKFCFTERVTKPWNTLPREVMEPPVSDILKTRLDLVLSNLL